MQRNEPLFASVIDQYWRKFSLLSVSASSGLQEPECRSGLRLESWGISKIEVELWFFHEMPEPELTRDISWIGMRLVWISLIVIIAGCLFSKAGYNVNYNCAKRLDRNYKNFETTWVLERFAWW